MTETTRTLATLELVGNAPCLAFTNTINSRREPEHDYLMSYSDLVRWTSKLGSLSPAQTSRLLKQAEQDPAEAERTFQAARALRELLYRLFSTASKGSGPDPKDLAAFVPSYAEALSHATLVRHGDPFKPIWKPDEALRAVLWPVAGSAGALLFSKELRLVKECPGCGWLFLDTSKNQTRRWCSMNTCGSRDKMRRYLKTKRGQRK
jgi:predicted RNA-binding Zn ribbon-like protein